MFESFIAASKSAALAVFAAIMSVATWVMSPVRTYVNVWKRTYKMLISSLPRAPGGKYQGIQRGVSTPIAILGLVVAIGVAVFVLALLIPTSFDTYFGVSTASWDPQTVALWVAIPVFALLAIALAFIFMAIRQAD